MADEGWGTSSIDKRRRLGVEQPRAACLPTSGVEVRQVTALLQEKKECL